MRPLIKRLTDTAHLQKRDGFGCSAALMCEAVAEIQRLQAHCVAAERERDELRAAVERVRAILDEPDPAEFMRATEVEMRYQRFRWDADGDADKADADWFWLIGYLAGKALHNPDGDRQKKLHRITTIAAAAGNWHAAVLGRHAMRPGIAPPAALNPQSGVSK